MSICRRVSLPWWRWGRRPSPARRSWPTQAARRPADMVFIGYPHRRRAVPFRLLLPSLITTIALCSGLASIHFSLKASALRGFGGPEVVNPEVDRRWEKALACIFLAAFFDMLDGRAARLLRAQSPFGAVLDSLSDFLCFGVAPALLLHQWTLS